MRCQQCAVTSDPPSRHRALLVVIIIIIIIIVVVAAALVYAAIQTSAAVPSRAAGGGGGGAAAWLLGRRHQRRKPLSRASPPPLSLVRHRGVAGWARELACLHGPPDPKDDANDRGDEVKDARVGRRLGEVGHVAGDVQVVVVLRAGRGETRGGG